MCLCRYGLLISDVLYVLFLSNCVYTYKVCAAFNTCSKYHPVYLTRICEERTFLRVLVMHGPSQPSNHKIYIFVIL